jgi:hypothetical protein
LKTKTEKLLSHKRKRKGILVPLLEDLLMEPLEVQTPGDANWLDDLIRAGMEREYRRLSEPVYSPSALSTCLRRVYLTRHHSELSVKTKPLSPSAHYYFTTGNWVHVKWQFALYKLHQKRWLELVAVEKPVLSKRKDHGGTPDAVVQIAGRNLLIDFKGLNVRDFGKIVRGDVPPEYALQLSDYAMLINSSREWDIAIDGALLVVESKGGPDSSHPIALHEVEIPIEKHLAEVRYRLQTLREHEEKNTIPPPECTSLGSFQYTSCPFQAYCKVEVKTIQIRNSKSSDSDRLKVSVPEKRRSNRTGRNKSRR